MWNTVQRQAVPVSINSFFAHTCALLPFHQNRNQDEVKSHPQSQVLYKGDLNSHLTHLGLAYVKAHNERFGGLTDLYQQVCPVIRRTGQRQTSGRWLHSQTAYHPPSAVKRKGERNINGTWDVCFDWTYFNNLNCSTLQTKEKRKERKRKKSASWGSGSWEMWSVTRYERHGTATTYALDFGSQFFWILDVTWITYIFLNGESLQIRKNAHLWLKY